MVRMVYRVPSFGCVHFLVFAKVVVGITVLKSINAHNTNVANFFIVISSFLISSDLLILPYFAMIATPTYFSCNGIFLP